MVQQALEPPLSNCFDVLRELAAVQSLTLAYINLFDHMLCANTWLLG